MSIDLHALAAALKLTDDDFSDVIDLNESTYFSPDGGRTRVRGGGLGNDSYVAEIVGTHPTYDFDRTFVDKDENLSRSRASGEIYFRYDGDGLYSYGRVTTSSSHTKSGFFLVFDGKIADLGNRRATIHKALSALEAEAKG